MGANEKRMRIHPFSAALRPSGNQQVSCARGQASRLVGRSVAPLGMPPMAGIAGIDVREPRCSAADRRYPASRRP